jgi:hypothetical protein
MKYKKDPTLANVEDDFLEALYTGALASMLAGFYYGFTDKVRIRILNQNIFTWAYIGLTTTVGTLTSDLLVDSDEPLLAALSAATVTVGANALMESPVPHAVVAAVTGVPTYVKTMRKN